MNATSSADVDSPPLRVAVLGAGGVGGYFGGVLARAGAHVTLLARGDHLAAIRSRGLELRTGPDAAASSDGATGARIPVDATDDPDALPDVDVVLVAVKSYSLADVAPAAARLARGGATVIPLLNGVDAAERLADAGVPRGALLGGSTVISAARVAPGVIERRSAVRQVTVGPLAAMPGDGGRDVRHAHADRLLAALRAGGVDARHSSAMDVELWHKFIFLTTLAAACGLARGDVGTVRAAPYGPLLVERAAAELVTVARAAGVAVDADVERRTVDTIAGLPAAMRPSFLLDLQRGGPTELDVLSGAVARLGRALGVPTPIHDTAVAALAAATGARVRAA